MTTRLQSMRGVRGSMLMEVMAGVSILCSSLLIFAMGAYQLSKLFRETYSIAVSDAVRLDSLNLEVRRDERASLAAFSGSGDLTLDGAPFVGTTYPANAIGADWTSSAGFLADLTAHYAGAERTLAVTPNTPVEQASWLLFLSPGGRVTAYYRYVNYETVDAYGYVTTETLVERYALLNPADTALTLTYSIGVSAPGKTLGDLIAWDNDARAETNVATGQIVSVLPSAFLGGEHLYDRTKLLLEAREASPRALSVRPGFQP